MNKFKILIVIGATILLGALFAVSGVEALTKLFIYQGGTGTTTASTGGIWFADSSSFKQDPTKLFWDDSNNYLGIGTTTPSSELMVVGDTKLGGSNVDSTYIYNLYPTGDGANSILLKMNDDGVAAGSESIAIGGIASNTRDIAIGADAISYSNGGVAIGYSTENYSTYGVSIGYNSKVHSGVTRGIAIGGVAQASGDYSIAIGGVAQASGADSMALGDGTVAGALGDIALGHGASANGGNTISIGESATSIIPNSMTIGGAGAYGGTDYIDTIILGSVYATNTRDKVIKVAYPSGTDYGGGDLTIQSGESTGNALPGRLIFSTSEAGSSGSSVNTATEKMTILWDGSIGIATSTPAYKLTVAGDMMITGAIYDNNYSYGTNGQVLKSDGAGGLTWGTDNTGGEFSTSTADYWFGNTSGITGNTGITTLGYITSGDWQSTYQGWSLATSTVVCTSPDICEYQCDGTADDVQINSALDSYANIFVKEGTYNLSAPLYINTNNTLEGAGNGATILTLATGVNDDMITTDLGSLVYFVNIRNIRMEGNKTNQTAGNCIHALYAHTWLIENMHVKECDTNGIKIEGNAGNIALNNTILNNRIEDTGSTALFLADYAPNNHIRGNILGGTDAFYCADLANDEIDFIDNHLHSCNSHGLNISGDNNHIMGNYLENLAGAGGHGINITSTGGWNRIISNTAFNNNLDGLNIDGDYTIVSNNRFFDRQGTKTQDYGIDIGSGALGTIVSNNLLLDNATGELNNNGVDTTLMNNGTSTDNQIFEDLLIQTSANDASLLTLKTTQGQVGVLLDTSSGSNKDFLFFNNYGSFIISNTTDNVDYITVNGSNHVMGIMPNGDGGNVGVGTSTPVTEFHVQGTTTSSFLDITDGTHGMRVIPGINTTTLEFY